MSARSGQVNQGKQNGKLCERGESVNKAGEGMKYSERQAGGGGCLANRIAIPADASPFRLQATTSPRTCTLLHQTD